MTLDKTDLLKMANNPDFIPGIYNYCDRWCEHCPFTLRCMVYAMEKETFPDQQSRDINNKEFWHRIQQSITLGGSCCKTWQKPEALSYPLFCRKR